MDIVKFSPTENRILAVLNDGQQHTPSELLKCLGDELQSKDNVNVHIANIRKKLKRQAKGFEIASVTRTKGFFYQLVQQHVNE